MEASGNHFAEICSGSEAGSFLRLMDFVYHSTLRLREIKKKRRSIVWNMSGEQLRVGAVMNPILLVLGGEGSYDSGTPVHPESHLQEDATGPFFSLLYYS